MWSCVFLQADGLHGSRCCRDGWQQTQIQKSTQRNANQFSDLTSSGTRVKHGALLRKVTRGVVESCLWEQKRTPAATDQRNGETSEGEVFTLAFLCRRP